MPSPGRSPSPMPATGRGRDLRLRSVGAVITTIDGQVKAAANPSTYVPEHDRIPVGEHAAPPARSLLSAVGGWPQVVWVNVFHGAVEEANGDESLGSTSDDDASRSACNAAMPHRPDRVHRDDAVTHLVLGRVIEGRCWHRAPRTKCKHRISWQQKNCGRTHTCQSADRCYWDAGRLLPPGAWSSARRRARRCPSARQSSAGHQ